MSRKGGVIPAHLVNLVRLEAFYAILEDVPPLPLPQHDTLTCAIAYRFLSTYPY
jgi:hypothetical protein